MHPVLKEIYALHPQATLTGALLMALRGRVEHKLGIDRKVRIGGDFELPKSLLIFGPNGTGKTQLFKRIIQGFGLEEERADGSTAAIFHSSLGCSTVVGIRDLLRKNSDCIHFFDEMSMATPGHVHLMKQIANGMVCYQKQGETEGFPFNGMILGALNKVKTPSDYDAADLLAAFDRFIVIKARPIANYSAEEYFDAVVDYTNREIEVDYEVLVDAIHNDDARDLNENEYKFAKKLWLAKAREILYEGVAQHRNIRDVLDVVRFVKRITSREDITRSKEIKSFAKAMVNDCVVMNPTPFLSRAQDAVYEVVKTNGEASFQDIARQCAMVAGGSNAQRVLDQLMNLGLICKTRYGMYSTMVSEERVAAKGKKKKATKRRQLAEML